MSIVQERNAKIIDGNAKSWMVTYINECPYCHKHVTDDTMDLDHHCPGSDEVVFAIRDQDDANQLALGLPLKEFCHDEGRHQ